jgi:hypothetical protein
VDAYGQPGDCHFTRGTGMAARERKELKEEGRVDETKQRN